MHGRFDIRREHRWLPGEPGLHAVGIHDHGHARVQIAQAVISVGRQDGEGQQIVPPALPETGEREGRAILA